MASSMEDSNSSGRPAAGLTSAADGHDATSTRPGAAAKHQKPLQLSTLQPTGISESQLGQQALSGPQQQPAAPETAPAPLARPAVPAGAAKQVLSLGAGFDTSFFQLVREGRAPAKYFEVDFKEVGPDECDCRLCRVLIVFQAVGAGRGSHRNPWRGTGRGWWCGDGSCCHSTQGSVQGK